MTDLEKKLVIRMLKWHAYNLSNESCSDYHLGDSEQGPFFFCCAGLAKEDIPEMAAKIAEHAGTEVSSEHPEWALDVDVVDYLIAKLEEELEG